MSIVSTAQERPDSPKVSGGLNQRTYTRTFLVVTDSKFDGPMTVAAAPGIPKLYSYYQFNGETDSYALLRNIQAERISDGSLQWEVTCEYSTPEPSTKGASSTDPAGTKHEQPGQNDNPLLQLPEIDFDFEQYQEVVYAVYDISDNSLKPCKASNSQVFDPPPTKFNSHMTMTITRNEPITAPHPALGVQYGNTTNSDTWWGLAPGVWMCMGIKPQRQTKQLDIGGIPSLLPYQRVTYKFQARATWDTLILDSGSWYIESSTGRKRGFVTDDGHPRTQGPLNGFGDKLADGDPPVFQTFRFYSRLPFSALNLPQSMLSFA